MEVTFFFHSVKFKILLLLEQRKELYQESVSKITRNQPHCVNRLTAKLYLMSLFDN